MGIDTVGLGLPGGMAGWTMLRTRKASDFKALTNDPQLKNDLDYLKQKLPAKATAKDMLSDLRLQRIVLQAYGLDSQVGMTGLMRRVLESDPSNSTSVAARMTDSRYLQLAKALNYGGPVTPAVPAVASQAQVTVDGLSQDGTVRSFSGTFAGISVQDLWTGGATTRADLAAQLQAAFRRADGGRTDISVSTLGPQLVFRDAKGRGTAKAFTFTTHGSASAVVDTKVAGQQATTATGGPKNADSNVLDVIGQLYTQARFEAAVGVTSDSQRAALYARRVLPQVSSWYNVIADKNLATVVRGALNLPDSFAQINVDQQVAVLKSKINIADFKDSTKLGKMLDKYVAMSAMQETEAQATNGIAALMQPIDLSSDPVTIDFTSLSGLTGFNRIV